MPAANMPFGFNGLPDFPRNKMRGGRASFRE
jgi:hypothetical protein